MERFCLRNRCSLEIWLGNTHFEWGIVFPALAAKICECPFSVWTWLSKYAAAAKSLQSCLTLCDPIDGSPPGSPIPGILQTRTLEWVAISFSNAWKWKVKGKLLSRVWLLATPWTTAYQAPPSMGFSRQEYWSQVPLPSPFLSWMVWFPMWYNKLLVLSSVLSSSRLMLNWVHNYKIPVILVLVI